MALAVQIRGNRRDGWLFNYCVRFRGFSDGRLVQCLHELRLSDLKYLSGTGNFCGALGPLPGDARRPTVDLRLEVQLGILQAVLDNLGLRAPVCLVLTCLDEALLQLLLLFRARLGTASALARSQFN